MRSFLTNCLPPSTQNISSNLHILRTYLNNKKIRYVNKNLEFSIIHFGRRGRKGGGEQERNDTKYITVHQTIIVRFIGTQRCHQ